MKVDLLGNKAPSILLMNAISKHFSTDELFDKVALKDGSEIEVKLIVNGHEVPFDLIVQNIYDHCEQIHDDEVIKKALRLLNLAGLDDLKDTMRKARENIENALETALRNLGNET